MSAAIIPVTPQTLVQAAAILRGGGLVAMPTETVYGLACDAANPDAVARLYEAKGRPSFNPLIAHISGPEMAAREGVLDARAQACAEAFWPGPLTLVVPAREGGATCELARAGLASIALRMPGHGAPRHIISALGRPIVAPSANRSGRISPVTARDVAEELGEGVDLILDGGRCELGLESTIVSFLTDPPQLLRPGGLARAEIEAVLGMGLAAAASAGDAPTAPGQLSRHYAPDAHIRLNATAPQPGEIFVGFGEVTGDYTLSATGSLREAAANLYPLLRKLDRHHDRIAICPLPAEGLGEAINDRLRRAAYRG